MSSTSNAPPQSSPPDGSELNASIGRLRAEHDVASSATTQAVLLHEVGVLEELVGDEASAARDHLAAVNSDPEFREPLERLIAIIERRQSYKNLGKVLERLVRVADSAGERARALIEQAAFLADHDSDLDGARLALLEASEQAPEDQAIWLGLELVAERLGDASLGERALAARTELVQDATLRGLLLIDLAERRAEQGGVEGALDALERAVTQGGEATFLALLAQERLAHGHDRPDVEAKALETQGELLLRAIADPNSGNAHGIPHHRRIRGVVADAWLRAAEIHQRRGDPARAMSVLERAISEVPGEPALLHAHLLLAEAVIDTETTARLAKSELELGVKGEPGAALWLRVAEVALGQGEKGAALEAVEQALTLFPGCAPARALQLELLSSQNESARLATAFEAVSEQLESESAKAGFYLLSADTWARLAGEVSGAKAALTQAAMFGAPPAVVARVARMLAAVVGDSGWYEEATRRLLAQGATEDEQAELWLELSRARALRHDVVGATAAFTSVASAPRGAWLGHTLGAYAVPWISAREEDETQISTDMKPWAALSALAELEPEPEAARALRTVVALRALLYADVNTAVNELSALHEADASDLVVTGALTLLLRERGELDKAQAVLARSASEVSDTEVATALHIAAGTLAWKLGERKQAVEAFQRAAEEQPEASASVLGWALRAAEPNDASARSKALDSLAETDPALAALERFTLEVGRGGAHDAAWDALATLRTFGDTALGRAGELARALWGVGSDAASTQREALDSLATRGPKLAELARALSHQLELGALGTPHAPDPARIAETAQHWTESDPSPAPALEWLAATIAANDTRKEVEARRTLARRLPEPASHALTASAALVAELSGQGGTSPLPSLHPTLSLANLELAGPGMDPGQRARALLEARPSLGEECFPLTTAMAGFNQLAAGDVDGAVASFRSVVEAHPNEVIGWEGLRATAVAQGDRATLAEASAALGDAVGDAALGARLWEEAATILLDELGDTLRGEFALSRATERDISRFSAFDRLFRLVRARKDGRTLLELIDRRSKVATDPKEITRLHWERARALREAGDREGALAALVKVRELEPNHVGALALMGEICITLQRFEEAADNLSRLARHPEAPGQQRLMSGVAAVDLYENRLKDLPKALDVLGGLYRAGLSTLPVRERLARTAAKTSSWEQATEVLEQLMTERDTAAGRIEAARLAMAIYRDELSMPEAAQDAVRRLLGEAPGDGEAIDLVLSGAFATSVSQALLQRGLQVLIQELAQNPTQRGIVERVARIAGQLGLLPLRQAALGVLVALGADATQIDPELRGLDDRVARQPRIAIDDASLPALIDPEDVDPLSSLMQVIATSVAEALGPGLAALGVGKRERVDPRAGLPLRNEVAAWAGALGIGEFELYIGGHDAQGVCVVATETPALVLGKEVTAPLSPHHRQAVARELLALRRGTSVLRHREPADIYALVVAACRNAEVEVPSPAFALLGEFQRQLKLPRRVRKILPDLAKAFRDSGQDPMVWYRAATSTLDRMAVVAAGDVSWVLASDARLRGRAATTVEGEQRARRLLSFVLSPTYLELREKLGMGVR